MDFLPLLQGKNRILLKAKPNSPKTEILKYDPDTDTFLVAVKAPPVEGKANAELERYFSKLLKRPVRLKSGAASKKKLLIVE